jgi:predicted CDP-diglyceride synthetase/phosphatidate cytidylyltransferase
MIFGILIESGFLNLHENIGLNAVAEKFWERSQIKAFTAMETAFAISHIFSILSFR